MSSVVISGDTSGAITLAAPAVSGTNTATLPAATGTVMVSGNMPAFSAYQNSSQTLANSTFTKIQFQTKEFDTSSAFDNTTNYRFQPTVAGYYQVNGAITPTIIVANALNIISIYKNGSRYKDGSSYGTSTSGCIASISALVYLNGSTDYVELYGYQQSGLNNPLTASLNATYFQASMTRAA